MLRKLGTISGLTLVSRIMGLLRDVVLAAVMGAGPLADAFMLAFRLPNHFRAIFAEGAFNAAFLPIWAATEARGEDNARLGSEVLGWLVLANVIVLAFALGATGWLLYLLAPGLTVDDPMRPLALTLTRITFPYLLCMSLVAFLSALLNSRDRFAATAGVSILLNLFMVAALLSAHLFPTVAHAAAWGVMLSGIAQVALLLAETWRVGIPLHLPALGLSPETRTFFRRLGPAILTSGALQVAIFADTVIATFLPEGSLSHLYYADRLYQLPVGLIGVALGTILLPDIGRRAGKGDEDGMRAVVDRALMICLAVGVPLTVLMALLGDWGMQILFMRGAFDIAAANAAGAILAAYAVGLIPALAVRSLVASFHGRGDTRTPLRILAGSTVLNIGLKVTLTPTLGAVGLALATSVGMVVYVGVLFAVAKRRGYASGPDVALVGGLVVSGIGAAGAVMAAKPWLGAQLGVLLATIVLVAVVCGLAMAVFQLHSRRVTARK